jgi:hypothetical protein
MLLESSIIVVQIQVHVRFPVAILADNTGEMVSNSRVNQRWLDIEVMSACFR